MKQIKSNANRIRKFRYYPDCLFFMLDAWLKRMSRKGYHLVNYGFITYTFEKGNPEDREYFTYSCERIGDGYFSISLRYPNLKNTFGKIRKKSKLNNTNNSKGVTIVEIDTDRIILEKNTCYKELINDRNKLYLLKTIRDVAVFALLLLILIVANF